MAVLLHGLWNWQPVQGLQLVAWYALIGFTGLAVLRRIAGTTSHETAEAVLALNPEAGAADDHAPHLTCGACGQVAPPGTHYCARCGAALRAGT